MMKLTMKIIGQILLSIDIEEYSPMLAQALHVGMNDVSERIRTPLYPPLWIPTAANRKTKKHLRFIDTFLIEMIHQRRITLQENEKLSDESSPTDVLTLLIQASDEEGRGLSDREIRDELATLIFAGFETTTNALHGHYVYYTKTKKSFKKGGKKYKVFFDLKIVLWNIFHNSNTYNPFWKNLCVSIPLHTQLEGLQSQILMLKAFPYKVILHWFVLI